MTNASQPARFSNDSGETLHERDGSDNYYANGSVYPGVRHSLQKTELAPKPANDPSQYSDGGVRAWLCVAGGFCCAFCSFGWVNAMGIFQEYYEKEMLSSYSPSTISWILSLETFFMFLGAPIIGKVYDRFGPRWLLLIGTFMHVFGLMMASLSTKYYQILLSQGICSPIGASMVMYPAISCVMTWFSKLRGLALGIMISGSSLGGVIFPIMVFKLIPEVGFPWTLRICAFLILGMLAVANFATHARIRPTPSPFSIMDFIRPFREPIFVVVAIANWFGFLGLFVPFAYLPSSAYDIGMSFGLSNALICMLNAGSIFGRILPGWASDKVGHLNTVIVMCTVSFVVIFAIWLPSRSNAPVIVFSVVYGFASGTFISLAPAVVGLITSDIRQIGTRTGTMFGFISVAALIGNPIAGALVDRDHGKYLYAQCFSGSAIALSTIIFVVAKSMCKGKFFKLF